MIRGGGFCDGFAILQDADSCICEGVSLVVSHRHMEGLRFLDQEWLPYAKAVIRNDDVERLFLVAGVDYMNCCEPGSESEEACFPPHSGTFVGMIQCVVIDTNASVDEWLILAHDERIEDYPRR